MRGASLLPDLKHTGFERREAGFIVVLNSEQNFQQKLSFFISLRSPIPV